MGLQSSFYVSCLPDKQAPIVGRGATLMSRISLHHRGKLALAACSITVIRLPVYFGYHRYFKIAVPLLFVVGIMSLLPLPHRRLTTRAIGAAWLYVAVVAVEILRGAQIGAYSDVTSGALEVATFGVVLLYAALLVATAQGQIERRQRLIALVFAPAIYVTANAFLHLMGAVAPATLNPETISVAASAPAQLLGLLGIHSLRVEFPLTTSINGFGIVAAAALAATAVLASRADSRALRLTCLGLAAASLYCLLLGDNRGALLIAVIVSSLLMVFRRLSAARIIALLLPAFPILVIWGLGLLGHSSIVSTFSRKGDNLATATDRLYIWEAAWSVLKHPSINWVYGWGAGGQITSGAVAGYARLFGTLSVARLESTHNVVIQTVVDGGLIALVLLVAACYRAIESLSRAADEPACAALLAGLLVVILSGLTEDTPTYYTHEAFLTVLLAFGAAAAVWEPPRARTLPSRHHSHKRVRQRFESPRESLGSSDLTVRIDSR
jgi:O-antigen ligase